MAELAGGEVLVEIALYNPASATTVSSISTTLFIGGVSFAHTSARGEVYAQSMLFERHDLWIIGVFEDPCAVNCCARLSRDSLAAQILLGGRASQGKPEGCHLRRTGVEKFPMTLTTRPKAPKRKSRSAYPVSADFVRVSSTAWLLPCRSDPATAERCEGQLRPKGIPWRTSL
jgi:hypothetical protein